MNGIIGNETKHLKDKIMTQCILMNHTFPPSIKNDALGPEENFVDGIHGTGDYSNIRSLL